MKSFSRLALVSSSKTTTAITRNLLFAANANSKRFFNSSLFYSMVTNQNNKKINLTTSELNNEKKTDNKLTLQEALNNFFNTKEFTGGQAFNLISFFGITFDEAMNVYERVKTTNSSLISVKFLSQMAHICKTQGSKNQKAKEKLNFFLQEISRLITEVPKDDLRVRLDSTAYSNLIVCLPVRDALKLFHETKESNITLRLFAYRSLLDNLITESLLDDALEILQIMKNVEQFPKMFEYTNLLRLCVRANRVDVALDMFYNIKDYKLENNQYSYNAIIKGLGDPKYKEDIKKIHEMAKKDNCMNSYVVSSLIRAYGKIGDLDESLALFEAYSKNANGEEIDIWNGMLAAYGFAGDVQKAIDFYEQMKTMKLNLNYITYTTIINIYAERGSVDEVLQIFKSLYRPDLVAYGCLIKTYINGNQMDNALDTFWKLEGLGLVPDAFVIATVLQGCKKPEDLEIGKKIQDYVKEKGLAENVIVKNAFSAMYERCEKQQQ